MRVEVLLFGAEAQALGRRSAAVVTEPGSTCATLLQQLAKDYAPLRPLLGAARFAINSEFAGPDRVVHEGDEVALIGMVSGG